MHECILNYMSNILIKEITGVGFILNFFEKLKKYDIIYISFIHGCIHIYIFVYIYTWLFYFLQCFSYYHNDTCFSFS